MCEHSDVSESYSVGLEWCLLISHLMTTDALVDFVLAPFTWTMALVTPLLPSKKVNAWQLRSIVQK